MPSFSKTIVIGSSGTEYALIEPEISTTTKTDLRCSLQDSGTFDRKYKSCYSSADDPCHCMCHEVSVRIVGVGAFGS